MNQITCIAVLIIALSAWSTQARHGHRSNNYRSSHHKLNPHKWNDYISNDHRMHDYTLNDDRLNGYRLNDDRAQYHRLNDYGLNVYEVDRQLADGSCKDVEKGSKCIHYAKKGYCTTKYAGWMRKNCCNTCQVCKCDTEGSTGVCPDENGQCECKANTVGRYCKQECRNEFSDDECNGYESRGLCGSRRYQDYLRRNCAKSCGFCVAVSPCDGCDINASCTSGRCQCKDGYKGSGKAGQCRKIVNAVNGGYSSWASFSRCTKSCGGGEKYRRRVCDNPKPGNGGADCSGLGPESESVVCNTEGCPVNGGYGEWAKFSVCTKSCGGGQKDRQRLCNNPKPENGGDDCSRLGAASESQACNTDACPEACADDPSFPCKRYANDKNCKKGANKYALLEKKCKKSCDLCGGGGGGGGGGGTTGKPANELPQQGCGRDVMSQFIVKRIVGGQKASKHRWIWQGALYYDGKYLCGGTLLTNNIFLTAAHCVIEKTSSSMEVKMGMHNRLSAGELHKQTSDVDAVLFHKFYWTRGDQVVNDIALIKVKAPFTLNDHVGIACLPQQNDKLPEHQRCYATGWGKLSHFGDYSSILMQAQLPIVASSKCTDHKKLTDKQFCAGSKSSSASTCIGDSGGPLVCKGKQQDTWCIQGIVSFGSNECKTTHRLSVFTRVSKYVTWIREAYGKLVTTQ